MGVVMPGQYRLMIICNQDSARKLYMWSIIMANTYVYHLTLCTTKMKFSLLPTNG